MYLVIWFIDILGITLKATRVDMIGRKTTQTNNNHIPCIITFKTTKNHPFCIKLFRQTRRTIWSKKSFSLPTPEKYTNDDKMQPKTIESGIMARATLY